MWIRLNRSVTLPLALKSQELQCAFCLCLSFSQKLAMSHFHRRAETSTKMEPHSRTIWILKRGCEKLLPWFPCTGDRSLCELLVHMDLYPQRRVGDATPELREDSVGWSYSM